MTIVRRKIQSALILVLVPFGLISAQQKHHMMMKSDSVAAQHVIYTCPMDPDVRSSKPGVCPKCGMDLVKMESSAPADTVKEMRPTKAELISNGDYNCCLEDPCDQCYREGENCNCYTTVKKTGVVCKECYKGWQHGKGHVPGIKKDSVKAETEKMESKDHHD